MYACCIVMHTVNLLFDFAYIDHHAWLAKFVQVVSSFLYYSAVSQSFRDKAAETIKSLCVDRTLSEEY